jgi:hypothetical protein
MNMGNTQIKINTATHQINKKITPKKPIHSRKNTKHLVGWEVQDATALICYDNVTMIKRKTFYPQRELSYGYCLVIIVIIVVTLYIKFPQFLPPSMSPFILSGHVFTFVYLMV